MPQRLLGPVKVAVDEIFNRDTANRIARKHRRIHKSSSNLAALDTMPASQPVKYRHDRRIRQRAGKGCLDIPYVRLPKSPKRLQTLEFQPGRQFARRHYLSPPRAPLSFSANADTGEGRVWTGGAAGGAGEGGGPGGRGGALTATAGAGCGATAAARLAARRSPHPAEIYLSSTRIGPGMKHRLSSTPRRAGPAR